MSYSHSEKKQEFLQNVKIAREERALEKRKEESVVILQSRVRGWLARRNYRKIILNEFDEIINENEQLKPAVHVFHLIRRFFSVWIEDADNCRFLNLCRYITKSLEEENASYSYVGVFLRKEYSVLWIAQLKEILRKCNTYLKNAFAVGEDTKTTKMSVTATELQNLMIILLHTMVSFTSVNTWRIFNSKNFRADNVRALKPSLNHLCNNVVGFLIQQDFYFTLREILCRSFIPAFGSGKLTLTNTSLMAVMILTCRPLVYSNFNDNITSKFVENILTIPAVIHHAHTTSPQFLLVFEEEQLLDCLMKFMNRYMTKERSEPKSTSKTTRVCYVDNVDEPLPYFTLTDRHNNLLCFTANFIELGNIYLECVRAKQQTLHFVNTLIFLLTKCHERVTSSRCSNLTQWHPILGWFSQDSYDMSVHECLPLMKHQLSLLWSKTFVSALFEEPLGIVTVTTTDKVLKSSSLSTTSLTSLPTSSLTSNLVMDMKESYFKKKALSLFADVTMANVRWKIKETDESESQATIRDCRKVLASACRLYHITIDTFVQLRLDILTGLCYQCDVLYLFWKYLSQSDCMKSFYRYVSSNGSHKIRMVDDNFQILLLFCECMIHYVTILDDVEMYEEQPMFCTSDFVHLSAFLNTFLYKGIINEVFRHENDDLFASSLFANTHALLTILYLRNCRRPYASSKSHWIIKDIKTSSLFNDSEKNSTKVSFLKSKMPHVISYSERVHMFKKTLFEEKCTIRQQSHRRLEGGVGINFSLSSLQSVRVIKVRRNHIVEDAFHYLHKLNILELKQAFRVKFLNAEGLEEAGVDQAGIFKEFMVDLIGNLFDPSLNLFRKTSQGHVYPSPMTNVSETNHLELIEFSGKMLAKAVYEGIVLDVRLASFFLSQILGQTQSSLYSYIDDLPSLDNDLYRSLMYVKHYLGDVSDLALTFSTTEEVFGSICTRELVPGGKMINVTDNNKIIYIHTMAHYRMRTQIKQQTTSFAKGFHSIFPKDSLSLFSVPELQLLISGEDQPLNFAQLRQNTQYYGGFHDSHKVIVWLWDILNNDFSEQERALFLKFVTSNSKPPVLGFAFLNPPFSIRCVEVSEDEDSGDSVGSVIRGFFTIRKKGPEHRLPTSSTCFNLLKLPNYSRKSVLRDKLRYAITANSGFELS